MTVTRHDSHQAPVLFISDLHLDASRPRIIDLFLHFLQQEAATASSLYILGDLFEAWIGDDAIAGDERTLAGLRALSQQGVAVYVMRGNRDFLLGEGFARGAGCTLLPDPTKIAIDGEMTLLSHGDALCTDDHDYQRFRAMVRDPAWQAEFLARPIAERLAYAQQARTESSERNDQLSPAIMDVNAEAVAQCLREHGVSRLIHGHTHRPAVHRFRLDGVDAERIVLGDWYDQGSVLRWENGAYELRGLPLLE